MNGRNLRGTALPRRPLCRHPAGGPRTRGDTPACAGRGRAAGMRVCVRARVHAAEGKSSQSPCEDQSWVETQGVSPQAVGRQQHRPAAASALKEGPNPGFYGALGGRCSKESPFLGVHKIGTLAFIYFISVISFELVLALKY